MRLATTTLIAALFVCLGGTAVAAGPGEDAALSGSSRRSLAPRQALPSRRRRGRGALRGAARQPAVRNYGPAAQTHDAAVLDALGIAATRKTLEAAVVKSQQQVALYDTRTRRVHVLRGAPNRRAAVARAFVNGLQDRQYGLGRTVVPERDARLAAARRGPGSCGARRRSPRARPGGAGAREPARSVRCARDLLHLLGRPSLLGDAAEPRRAPSGLDLLSRPPESTEQIFHIDKFLERERPAKIAFPAEPPGCGVRVSAASASSTCAPSSPSSVRRGSTRRAPDGPAAGPRSTAAAAPRRRSSCSRGTPGRRRRMGAGGTHLPRSRAGRTGREAVAL